MNLNPGQVAIMLLTYVTQSFHQRHPHLIKVAQTQFLDAGVLAVENQNGNS